MGGRHQYTVEVPGPSISIPPLSKPRNYMDNDTLVTKTSDL